MTNQDQIENNLSQARFICEEAHSAIRTAANLFFWDMGSTLLLIHGDGQCHWLDQAQSTLAALKAYLKEPLTGETYGDEAVLRSKRKVQVAQLLEAHINASVARAYVELWQSSPGYKQYAPLGHQALAYADCVQRDNWDFFAPLVFYRPQERLFEEIEKQLRALSRYGDLALSYGCTLQAQMQVCPTRLQNRVEPRRVPKPEGFDNRVAVMKLPQLESLLSDGTTSQQQAQEIHFSSTRDEKLRQSCYGPRPPAQTYPLQRLVGFHRVRGGNKKH